MYNIDPVNGWVEAFLMWGGWDYINGSRDGLRDGSVYIASLRLVVASSPGIN